MSDVSKGNRGRINTGKCKHCNLPSTHEGHDGCIGSLPYPVMNACCGHGNFDLAYVQLDHTDYKNQPNKKILVGATALGYILLNKGKSKMSESYVESSMNPKEIDDLRFLAFKTNKQDDIIAYYKAASAYFQDRHVRAMNRATPTREQIMADERVQALVKALRVYSEPCEATETSSCGFEGNMCCMAARDALAALPESP